MNNNQLKVISLSTLALAVVASLLTLLVPAPAGIDPSAFRSLFFITTFLIVTHFGGALLFWLGLKGFTPSFKAAYRWLVLGFIMLALGFVQLPVVVLLNASDSAWSRYGLVAIPFMASVVFIYIGVRGFAKLFGVRSVLTSAWKAFGLALIVASFSLLLPHNNPNVNVAESTILISLFAGMLPSAFNLWTVILCYQTRKQAGSLYAAATAWLFVYLAIDSASSIFGFVARLFEPGQSIVFETGIGYILYAIAGVVLLKAGVEFNKISITQPSSVPVGEQSFFGKPKNIRVTTESLTDIVLYAAGLSSNVQAIDPILEEVRMVTADHSAGQAFNDLQQQRLADVYLRIEAYLSSQEPVRPVGSVELRGQIKTKFSGLLQQNPIFVQTAALS